MRRAVVVAGFLVTLAGGSAAADGKHVPDQPYRWASGASELTAPLYRDGSSPPMNAATPETGPQASVAVPQGALEVPAGATAVRVALSVTDAGRTRSGPALSNRYLLVLQDDRGRGLAARPERRAVTVLLRAAAAPTVAPAVELTTERGTEVLAVRSVHEGLYAVDVREPGALVLVDRTARVDDGTAAALPVGPVGAVSASALVLLGSAAALRRRNRPVRRETVPGAQPPDA